MMKIDDETLMAFVDGELDGAGMARVGERLQLDTELRKRARTYQDSARVLQQAFEPQLRRPVPGKILGLLRPAVDRAASGGGAARFGGLRTSRLMSSPVLALAASLLLTVGITVGVVASRAIVQGTTSGSSVIAILDGADGWDRGFDTTMSGKPFSVGVSGEGRSAAVVPLTTFLDQDDRYCRSFQRSVTSRADIERLRGIACRDVASGSWRTRVVVADATAAADRTEQPSGDASYRPAASSSGDGFERLLETFMTTSPMSADQEAGLIERGWE
jgi:surface antigen